MSAESDRVAAEFERLLELEESLRKHRLTGIRRTDPALATELESLLRAHERAGGFLEPVPGAALVRAARLVDPIESGGTDPLLGRRLGAFRLERHLGSGGMGSVYLARREEGGFEQVVAVKVLRSFAFDPGARDRFLNECRALSRLSHPSITRLLDGFVTEDGTPVILMEYVEGLALDRHCREHALSTRETVALFLELCEAVDHAHRHSVLHRDLKPANVLVTGDGRLKLADFGIARILDAAEGEAVTRSAVMTPLYASPEQLRGEILSTRSDVFALGAILYRLLTERTAFGDTATPVRELERRMIEERPSRPSAIAAESGRPLPSDLAGDLDAITAKALRADPDRRYASARHLAEDLRRSLRGEVVEARPESLGYRFGRLVRRHRLVSALVATIVVGLFAASSLGFGLYLRAERARAAAVLAGEDARRQQERAEAIRDALVSLVQAADPMSAGVDGDPTLREALEGFSSRIERELSSEPAVAATLHRTVGTAFLGLSQYDRAEAEIDRSIALLDSIGPREPAEYAASLIARGRIAFAKERTEDAVLALRAAIAVCAADSIALSAHLVEAEVVLAHVLSFGGDPLAAEGPARRAVERSARLGPREQRRVAEARNELGMTYFRLGRYSEAEQEVRAALEAATTVLGARHAYVGELHSNLALVLRAQERPGEALESARHAMSVYETAYPAGHGEIGLTRVNLGDAHYVAGDAAGAAACYRSAIGELSAAFGPSHTYVGIATNNLAMALARTGDNAAAREAFERALVIYERTVGADHPEYAGTLTNLANMDLLLDRPSDAETHARAAIAIQSRSLPATHFQLAFARTLLAKARLARGDAEEARGLLDLALPSLRDQLPESHRTRRMAETLSARTDSLIAIGEPDALHD